MFRWSVRMQEAFTGRQIQEHTEVESCEYLVAAKAKAGYERQHKTVCTLDTAGLDWLLILPTGRIAAVVRIRAE